MAAITQLGPDNRPMVVYGTEAITPAVGLSLKQPQILATKQGYQVLATKRMGQIQWEN